MRVSGRSAAGGRALSTQRDADDPLTGVGAYRDKIAVIDGTVVLTYAEFGDPVDRAAAALYNNGFGSGDRLALQSRNSWQYTVPAFATAPK